MKRCMVIILLVCLALCCAGCAQQETVVSQPGNLAVSSVLIFEEKECMEECKLSDEVTGVWCAGLSIEPFMQLQLSAQQDGAYQLQTELIADGGHFKSDYKESGIVETLGTTCSFPQVGGEYQDISMEYVCDRIESCVRGNGNNGP